jgi:cytochrome c biogenesis protein ResB
MSKNFFLQEIKPEKEYEQNISGVIYEVTGTDAEDGIYINYVGQPITQTVTVDDDEYMVILRRERTYLPFLLSLVDFKKVMHPGTNIAKSYSSDVNLIENNVPRKVLISMNEPLRHREYTFYQASFIEDGLTQTSVLATVKNYGRLFPYISTIIMCIGLLYHMLFILSRRFKISNK